MKKTALLILFATISIMISKAQTDSTTYVNTGDAAPTFVCRTIDGKTIDISKLRGKIVMINFFATWCPPCNLELPVLQKNIWDKYKNNPNFVLVILGREHTEKEVRDFADSKKLNMPFAPDVNREIFNLYASQNIPRNVIIGTDGKVIFQSTGYSEKEFKKVENLLAESIK